MAQISTLVASSRAGYHHTSAGIVVVFNRGLAFDPDSRLPIRGGRDDALHTHCSIPGRVVCAKKRLRIRGHVGQ